MSELIKQRFESCNRGELSIEMPKKKGRRQQPLLRHRAVRVAICIFFKDDPPHHALVKEVQSKASGREPVVMTFQDHKGLSEKGDLAETFRMLCFQATKMYC